MHDVGRLRRTGLAAASRVAGCRRAGRERHVRRELARLRVERAGVGLPLDAVLPGAGQRRSACSPASTNIESGVPRKPPSLRLFCDAHRDRVGARLAACRPAARKTRGGAIAAAAPAAAAAPRCRRRRRRGSTDRPFTHTSAVLLMRPSESVAVAGAAAAHVDRAREPHHAVEVRQAARLPVARHLHVLPVGDSDALARARASRAWSRRAAARSAATSNGTRFRSALYSVEERRLVPGGGDVERAAQPAVAVVLRLLARRVERLAELR